MIFFPSILVDKSGSSTVKSNNNKWLQTRKMHKNHRKLSNIDKWVVSKARKEHNSLTKISGPFCAKSVCQKIKKKETIDLLENM